MGCTGEERTVARSDSNLKWNAVNRHTPLPYLCKSKCALGYSYYPALDRCLKATSPNSAVPVQLDIAHAHYTCAAEGARLATMRTCADLKALGDGLWDRYLNTGAEWFVGGSLGAWAGTEGRGRSLDSTNKVDR